MTEMINDRPGFAGTPGAAYVDKQLAEMQGADKEWIADSINTGALLVCPRCEFLHLPSPPLPLGLAKSTPAPADACDVCAHAHGAADLAFQVDAAQMLEARAGLAEARMERAQVMFDLWMGASLAANTWVLARLGDVLADVKARGEA